MYLQTSIEILNPE